MMNASEAPVITLEQVDVGFASELSALWWETFADAYRDEHAPEDIEAYCDANFSVSTAKRMLEDPATVCKVAQENANNVGYYLLIHTDCPVSLGGEASELKQIYLRSAAYGTGLGHRLLSDAAETIEDAGRSWVWLSVSDRNHRARSFYERHDFGPVGAGPVFEVGRDRLTSTMMARRVPIR